MAELLLYKEGSFILLPADDMTTVADNIAVAWSRDNGMAVVAPGLTPTGGGSVPRQGG